MGRVSKLHKKLTQESERKYFLENPEVKEYLSVLDKIVQSLLKSKGNRRKMYREQLRNAHEHLAVTALLKQTLEKREDKLEARIEKQEKTIAKLEASTVSYTVAGAKAKAP